MQQEIHSKRQLLLDQQRLSQLQRSGLATQNLDGTQQSGSSSNKKNRFNATLSATRSVFDALDEYEEEASSFQDSFQTVGTNFSNYSPGSSLTGVSEFTQTSSKVLLDLTQATEVNSYLSDVDSADEIALSSKDTHYGCANKIEFLIKYLPLLYTNALEAGRAGRPNCSEFTKKHFSVDYNIQSFESCRKFL